MNEIFRFMQAEDSSQLDLYIYQSVQSGYEYDWENGECKQNRASAKYFANELAKYNNVSQINLHINSNGGMISEGTAIRNLLKQHHAKVLAYIDGWACSIASVIATAADEVIMYNNSMMYLHRALSSITGNSEALRKEADALDKMTDSAIECYVEKCGGKSDKKKIKQIVENETWLTAQECFEIGLCDKIVDEKAPDTMNMLESIKHYEMSANMKEQIDSFIEKYKVSAESGNANPTTDQQKEKLENVFKEFLKI